MIKLDYEAIFTSKAVRVTVACVAALILGWYLLTQVNSCRTNREIDKARANVNAALANVNASKGTVANDRVDEAVAIEKVKEAVNGAIAASTATDQAKAETNAAVANYEAAKKAGQPTGTTEADLDAKLKALGN
tara:strand:- start:60 stop:461 length:402 start_codon:yes stop_codon:yes gene_type:complete